MFFHGTGCRDKELNCISNSMDEQGQEAVHLGHKRMQYVQQRSFSES